jgi:alkylation response protein AidB-like acyl-CoA dehydrogenase
VYFGPSDEARELAAAVRELLVDACTPAVIRGAWDGSGIDKLWKDLGSLGLLGLVVSEGHGGLGLDDLVAVEVLRECGYAGVPGPLVETAYVAAPLLATGGVLPPGLLDGKIPVAVQQHTELVANAATAPLVLQLADRSPRLLVTSSAALPSVDASRALGLVTGRGEPFDVPAAAVALAIERGALGTAAFLIGLGQRMLDLTVAYARDRKQFGVPIGSFQAVKHPLADATVGLEFAWPAVLRAAQSLVDDDPLTEVHVSMAKALASDAAYRMSRVALQAHGAMGYTVEYDLHLFAKRTWALAKDWGTASQHRGRVAAHLGIERTAP